MTDTTMRNAGLRQMLSERRREYAGRHPASPPRRAHRPNEVRADLEHSDIQGDIEFALLQMRAETLTRIDEALVRLDAGEYGSCVECAGEISERRLRALPFAVRCQACEERREQEQWTRAADRSAARQPLALPGCGQFLTQRLLRLRAEGIGDAFDRRVDVQCSSPVA